MEEGKDSQELPQGGELSHEQWLRKHYREMVETFSKEALIGRLVAERRVFERRVDYDGLLRDKGVLNQGGLARALERELAKAKRNKTSLWVLALDVDYLKRVNDEYGDHAVGDEVLRTYAEEMRDSDIRGRRGGDEFVLLLPGFKKKDAMKIAKRIRKGIPEAIRKKGEEGKLPKFGWRQTVSMGLTKARAKDTVETLSKRADEALYKAKEQGRDRIVVL